MTHAVESIEHRQTGLMQSHHVQKARLDKVLELTTSSQDKLTKLESGQQRLMNAVTVGLHSSLTAMLRRDGGGGFPRGNIPMFQATLDGNGDPECPFSAWQTQVSFALTEHPRRGDIKHCQ